MFLPVSSMILFHKFSLANCGPSIASISKQNKNRLRKGKQHAAFFVVQLPMCSKVMNRRHRFSLLCLAALPNALVSHCQFHDWKKVEFD